MVPRARVHPNFEALEVVLEPAGHRLLAYLPAIVLKSCFGAADNSDWLAVYALHKAHINEAILAKARQLPSLSVVMVMTEHDFSEDHSLSQVGPRG